MAETTPTQVNPTSRRLFKNRSLLFAVIGFLSIFIVVGVLVPLGDWPFGERSTPGILAAAGTIEGQQVTVASKLPGRVAVMAVTEGERIEAGALVATLESDELQAGQEQAEAQVEVALSQQTQARAAAGALAHQLEGASLEIETTIRQAEEQLAQAKAALVQAQANLTLERDRKQRSQKLYEDGVITEFEWRQVQTAYDVAAAQVDQAQAGQATAEAAIDQARGAWHKIEALKQQKEQAEQNLELALAREKAARAALRNAALALEDTRITAPIAGTVLTRTVDRGELVARGTPLAVLVDLDQLSVRAYLPEATAGRVSLGDAARVQVDAYPDRWFPAKVTYISQEAQYTPKSVQTAEERTRLVYEVKLAVENTEGLLNPGLPADIQIKVDDGTAWPEGR